MSVVYTSTDITVWERYSQSVERYQQSEERYSQSEERYSQSVERYSQSVERYSQSVERYSVCRAIFAVCRAIIAVCRAIIAVCRAILAVCRAILSLQSDTQSVERYSQVGWSTDLTMYELRRFLRHCFVHEVITTYQLSTQHQIQRAECLSCSTQTVASPEYRN